MLPLGNYCWQCKSRTPLQVHTVLFELRDTKNSKPPPLPLLRSAFCGPLEGSARTRAAKIGAPKPAQPSRSVSSVSANGLHSTTINLLCPSPFWRKLSRGASLNGMHDLTAPCQPHDCCTLNSCTVQHAESSGTSKSRLCVSCTICELQKAKRAEYALVDTRDASHSRELSLKKCNLRRYGRIKARLASSLWIRQPQVTQVHSDSTFCPHLGTHW